METGGNGLVQLRKEREGFLREQASLLHGERERAVARDLGLHLRKIVLVDDDADLLVVPRRSAHERVRTVDPLLQERVLALGGFTGSDRRWRRDDELDAVGEQQLHFRRRGHRDVRHFRRHERGAESGRAEHGDSQSTGDQVLRERHEGVWGGSMAAEHGERGGGHGVARSRGAGKGETST